MIKRISILIAAIFLTISYSYGQAIIFSGKTLDEALVEAAKSDKLVFIDVYADWCMPCKILEKDVFSVAEVGNYMNKNFVNIKLDHDNESNKKLIKKYKVTALPTLLFLDKDGELVQKIVGMKDVKGFLSTAKIATGDEKTFDEMWDIYKKNPKDLVIMQKMLVDARGFIQSLKEMELEKWIIRVEKLFADYIELKMGEDLINEDDYKIILDCHAPAAKDDKIVEFINKNIDKYIEKMGTPPAYYVMEYHDDIVSNMARNGDLNYLKELDRINGDMKSVYDATIKTKLTPYEVKKYIYDAEYQIFHLQDVKKYVKTIKSYIAKAGDEINPIFYAQSAQNMYYSMSKKMVKKDHEQASEWLITALNGDLPVFERINILVLLGDSTRDRKLYDEAKKYYNQAYMESMQLEGGMDGARIQYAIKRKIEELSLLQ